MEPIVEEQTDTKAKILEIAKKYFAAQGFYGTSLAGIGRELGITKQALLHHYASKERLYGEVLKGISAQMMVVIQRAQKNDASPMRQLQAVFAELFAADEASRLDVQIIVRELLDVESLFDFAEN